MPINGLVVMTPSSIASTGTGNSSSINADGSVDFASCTTLSLNGVFTSSYDNYMIVCRSNGSSSLNQYQGRLRANGTDNATASSYVSQLMDADATLIGASRNTNDFFNTFFNTSSTTRSGVTIYVFGPYLAQPTALRTTTVAGYLSAYLNDVAATHNQSTAYDGITIYGGTGSISGLITVFGFNQ